jgi:hypothetical protein
MGYNQPSIHSFAYPKSIDKPPSTVLFSILLNISINKIKGKGDKEFPCLNPCELLKKPVGEPFTKIENRTAEIHT